jgi:hypothetical protein
LNPDYVKGRLTRINIEGQRMMYTLDPEELDAILLPDSPSSNYQLYKVWGTSMGAFRGAFWYLDGVAGKNGQEIVDPEWGFFDFVGKYLSCSS